MPQQAWREKEDWTSRKIEAKGFSIWDEKEVYGLNDEEMQFEIRRLNDVIDVHIRSGFECKAIAEDQERMDKMSTINFLVYEQRAEA